MTGWFKQELPRVKLTPQQETMWEATTSAFLWHCPAFAHIYYNMLDRQGETHHAVFTNSEKVKVAATDGFAVAFNPENFFKYNLHGRVFIFCHEVIHCIWDHCGMARKFRMAGEIVYEDGTRLPYIDKIMAWANDYVINDTLVNAQHGRIPEDGLWNTDIGTWEEACVDVYRKIYQQCKKGGGGGMPGPNQTGFGGQEPFDVLLEPGEISGKDPADAAMERNDTEWRATCETAIRVAEMRGQGTMPGSLKRLFGESLVPHVPWEEHVETILARTFGSDGYNWRRANRQLIVRDIYAPGRTGHGAKLVVVGSDTSGSVGDKETDMFFAELAGMFEGLRPEQLVIMWCDSKVHDVSYCDDAQDLNIIREEGVGGGGGTSFVPVFDMIEELGMVPDALIYLTDGMGTFPREAPDYPVIWGSILLKPEHFPFGEVVMVPKQAE